MAVAYPTLVDVITSDTFEEWRKKTNSMIAHAQASQSNLGTLSFLSTDAQTTAVDAINEVHTDANNALTSIGSLSALTTPEPHDTLVNALNSLHDFHVVNTNAKVKIETDRAVGIESNIQSELDNTQTGAGLGATGTFTATDNNYLSGATSLKNATDLLDTQLYATNTMSENLKTTMGAASTGFFNWSDETVEYLTVESTGNASIKKSLVKLDGTIKASADTAAALASTVSAVSDELSATQVNSGLGTDGTYTTNTSLNYINTATTLKGADELIDAALKTIDDSLTLAKQNITTNLSNIRTRSLQAETGDITTLNSGIADTTTLVSAINSLYAMILPLSQGTSNYYLRKDIAQTMAGTLTITAPLLVKGDGTSKTIQCSGDIIAYADIP